MHMRERQYLDAKQQDENIGKHQHCSV